MVRRWLPVTAWAALIFTFSTGAFGGQQTGAFLLPLLARLLPGASPDTLLALHAGVRKLAHFSEYAVLSGLWYRALHDGARPQGAAHRGAILGATLYAITDEAHQLFVPNRTGAVGDVLVDAAGVVAAQAAIALGRRFTRRRPAGS